MTHISFPQAASVKPNIYTAAKGKPAGQEATPADLLLQTGSYQQSQPTETTASGGQRDDTRGTNETNGLLDKRQTQPASNPTQLDTEALNRALNALDQAGNSEAGFAMAGAQLGTQAASFGLKRESTEAYSNSVNLRLDTGVESFSTPPDQLFSFASAVGDTGETTRIKQGVQEVQSTLTSKSNTLTQQVKSESQVAQQVSKVAELSVYVGMPLLNAGRGMMQEATNKLLMAIGLGSNPLYKEDANALQEQATEQIKLAKTTLSKAEEAFETSSTGHQVASETLRKTLDEFGEVGNELITGTQQQLAQLNEAAKRQQTLKASQLG